MSAKPETLKTLAERRDANICLLIRMMGIKELMELLPDPLAISKEEVDRYPGRHNSSINPDRLYVEACVYTCALRERLAPAPKGPALN